MMTMQIKFFQGEVLDVEKDFNAWSNGNQYISETSLHFKGKDRSFAVLKVVYGMKEGEAPQKTVVQKKNKFSLY